MRYNCQLALILTTLTLSAVGGAAPARLGATLDYREVLHSYTLNGADVVRHYDTAGASLILDLRYLRLGAGASHNFGRMITFIDGEEHKDSNYRLARMHLSALGKIPMEVGQGAVQLWPAMGLELDASLRNAYVGSGKAPMDPKPTDLSVAVGGGIDYAVSKRWSLTGSLLGSCVLTPSDTEGATSKLGFALRLSAGVLYTL